MVIEKINKEGHNAAFNPVAIHCIPFYFGIILQVYDIEIVFFRQFNELFVFRASRLHDSYR